MPPLNIYQPTDAQTAASMLAIAAADGVAMVPEGHRTKLAADLNDSGAALMATTQLTSGLAHYAGDLVATAPAGMTLREVNDRLARERQCIPLDPPFAEHATIGGIVATNDSGPRRHRFGSPRDLIIGIEVALTNGRVVHSGGRVVKNVAGYDLARLLCGSRGSLGIITAVNFRLAPLPPTSRTLVARFNDVGTAATAALALASSPSLTPSAVELVAPQPRLLVRFETTESAAERMSAAARGILSPTADEIGTLTEQFEAKLWADHQNAMSPDSGLVAHVSVLPTQVAATIADIERLSVNSGLTWGVASRAALGVLRVCCQGGADAQLTFAKALRAVVEPRGGHVQVQRLEGTRQSDFELLGSLGSATAVALAVKRRFDPTGVLPYPWARS